MSTVLSYVTCVVQCFCGWWSYFPHQWWCRLSGGTVTSV